MNQFRLSFFSKSVLVFFVFFCSCKPSKYFLHYSYLADSIKSNQLTVKLPELHKLKKGDRIKIYVTALNVEAANQFAMTSITNDPEIPGYLVDNSGTIVFPELGHVVVEGLTTDSVATLLEQKLTQYLTSPAVSVTYANFIIKILGDVGRPGYVTLQDGKNTIFDAISKAMDLSSNGKREDILVVREKNGKREFGRIDLSSKDVFNSSYYYLEPGDLIYVEPSINKLLGLDTYQQRRITMVGLSLTIGSFLFLLKNYLKI